MSRIGRLARWLPLLLVLSCAAPAELARRSDEALGAGDTRKAYDLAKKALDHDPTNAAARGAMQRSAQAITDDWKQRIRNLTEADTVAAARQAIELAAFRAEVARYPVTLAPDSAWTAHERLLRRAAARTFYDLGTLSLADRRPKKAYDQLVEAERFDGGYRDVGTLVGRAYERAATRVLVLPLADRPSRTGMGTRLAELYYQELARHVGPRDLRFIHFVAPADAYGVMTVSQLGRLSRDDAVDLARRLGARWVVWGRVGGVRADTRTDHWGDSIWRRVVEKDANGQEAERWVEVPFEVVTRARDVDVDVDLEVLSADEEVTLARDSGTRSLGARTVWTSYQPEGDPDRYALVPPDVRSADPERAEAVENRWKTVVGEKLPVAQLLQRVRREHPHADYQRDDLPAFYPGASGPVFLNDLPPAEDLAFAALMHEWQPLLGALQRLDAVDDVDLAPRE